MALSTANDPERDDDELGKLERFAGADPKAAEDAFTHLSNRIERFLWRYLATLVPLPQDRDDVIATVLEKLYSRRCEFHVQGLGAWYAFVATTARRCAWDRASKHEFLELNEEIPARDLELIANVAEMSHLRSLLYATADELWLGVSRDQSPAERNRKLLAAQLYYLHGRPWEEVCRLVGKEKPIGRKMIDSWLSEPAVLRDMAYQSLYVDNDSLICALLGKDRPLSSHELEQLSVAAEKGLGDPPAGWTWSEIKIAIWRYRNGLLTEKILQMDPALKREQVDAALARCRLQLPFEKIAVTIQEALIKKRAPVNPLSAPELWKRLVFQYSAIHELPHKQILERTEPAARVAGYSLTAAVLNGWLCNGRLTEQLAKYAKKEHHE